MRVPKWSFVFLQQNTKFYSCTQTAIHFFFCFFFTAKYKILQYYSNGSLFFTAKNGIENCTLFDKLFRNGHLLFSNKLINLKLHPNFHSFLFDHKIKNLKSYSNGHLFFDYKQRK